jgi:CIC family chloride channel protein
MIRKVIQEEEIFDLVNAKDLGNENFLTVTPQDDLNAALDKIIRVDQEEILVVDTADPNKVLTTLSRRDIIIAYNREIEQQKSR